MLVNFSQKSDLYHFSHYEGIMTIILFMVANNYAFWHNELNKTHYIKLNTKAIHQKEIRFMLINSFEVLKKLGKIDENRDLKKFFGKFSKNLIFVYFFTFQGIMTIILIMVADNHSFGHQ